MANRGGLAYNAVMQWNQLLVLTSLIFEKWRAKFSALAALVCILLVGVFLVISNIYVFSTSRLVLSNFVSQNKIEIGAADTIGLASRLNSLSSHPEIRCLAAEYKGVRFFEYNSHVCGDGFFSAFNQMEFVESGIKIFINTQLTKSLFGIFLALLLALYVFLCAVIYFYLAYLKERSQREKMMMEMASQVAHDIRSPLTALNLVSNQLIEVSEEKRILLRNATQRINDIANDLLKFGKETLSAGSGNADLHMIKSRVMILSLVDALVSEKRTQFRGRHNISFELNLNNFYGVFSELYSSEIQRGLSNLINNAAEAIPPTIDGQISIWLEKVGDKFCLILQDNGKGIPDGVLRKFGERGNTHGKNGQDSGTGLGVYQALNAVKKSGGEITFESRTTFPTGTTVRIYFESEAPPNWFVPEIMLEEGMKVVVVDDDKAIHSGWIERLSPLVNAHQVSLDHFSSLADFTSWFQIRNRENRYLFLIDYEFLRDLDTGLNLIHNLDIVDQSFLVTSRFEERQLLDFAMSVGIRILPKTMIGLVPIKLGNAHSLKINSMINGSDLLGPPSTESSDKRFRYDLCLIDDDVQLINRPIETSSTPMSISKEKVRYDLCLIDDDQELIGVVWATVAAEKGLKIRLFATPQAFMAEADRIERQTPIYIDVSLGNGVSGLDVAHDVHKMGFTEINLATGYQADSMAVPPFICRVVGKDFPEV